MNDKTFQERLGIFLDTVPVSLDKDRSGQGYKYTDLPTLISTIKPVAKECGLLFLQSVVSAPGEIGIKTGVYDRSSSECYIELFTVPVEVTEQRGLKSGGLIMGRTQSVGAAITYFRRYALMTLCGIATEEDADARNASRESKINLISLEQALELEKLAKKNGHDTEAVLKSLGFKSLALIPVNRYQSAKSYFNKPSKG